MAFLPAALEIVETPPSPIGRAIALTLIAAFCAALVWASLGKVDNDRLGAGQDHPDRPQQTGVVRAVHERALSRNSAAMRKKFRCSVEKFRCSAE
jgi:hemolysin D